MPTIARLNRSRNRSRKRSRNRNPSGLPCLLAVTILVCLVVLSPFGAPKVAAFQSIGTLPPRTRVTTTPFATRPTRIASPSNRLCGNNNHGCYKNRMGSLVSNMASPDSDDNNTPETTSTKDNFDAEGFAGYLLPYAAALIGSVLATAAVFKFVLLDY